VGWIEKFFFTTLAVLSCIMGIVLWWHNSVFLFHGPENGFLLTKPNSVRYSIYLPAFYIHIVMGSLVLMLGVFQLSKVIRNRIPKWHRLAGKIYAFSILTVTAPTGFVMSLYANGGIISKSGFALLAVLWWFFTFRGFRSALDKNWNAHRKFMLRSYILTFAAVTLRLYSFLFALAGCRGEGVYQIIVWLCWLPSLIVIEVYFLTGGFSFRRQTTSKQEVIQ
jgi:hypothetical protein